ncbi:citrinin biosynthesis oxidoreductase CtnB [Colletotrichum graminicola]|uniref:Citrinin biosynthesis oxydoreductase CtnB n=1 Tax=Colletotrichum graminicola (strain M1.001 / M2 / FGSC 10212) TaxID=645133 RepID=E3QXY6_COLGM|nr:citrinin biosynthesis oxidoreductase CtnB [Colletotrichum graminicola M1.001]EFQ35725.1 citrinin biosynthesis oxydoreductase CtnB [Colletotrichum graminicola M1.001]WDK10334.1 citrinin biosynthesis oxidoreductase CtnB [Colletotrichum graminicola]
MPGAINIPSADSDPTLQLPRILCLHGGGVNAAVFKMQCRALIARLKKHFRLVFVDGPFICNPHHDIVAVYGDHGPFRRWLRWLPEHQYVDAETASAEIHFQLRMAMDDDDALGATGEWVGLLGFSQGAKVSASLLYTQQMLKEKYGKRIASAGGAADWKFGVLLAGRAPLIVLDDRIDAPQGVGDAAEASVDYHDWPNGLSNDHVLKVPTIHIHGLKDPGLQHHRRLLKQYCQPGTARLVEWDGAHRIPIKTWDVEAVASQILDLGREIGVLPPKEEGALE